MATTTPKLGLIKPDFVDVVDVSKLNDNMDVLDDALTDSSTLDDLSGVDLTSPTTGQLLQYDGTDWVNQALTSAQLPAGSIIAVKSAIFTGTQSATVAASANVAVTDLSITHEVADPANKLIITAVLGQVGTASGRAAVGLAVHDGSGLIGMPTGFGIRTPVGSVFRFSTTTTDDRQVSSPAITFVHTPGAGSKTYTVRAIQWESASATVYINRAEDDPDAGSRTRSISSLVIQEVAV